MSYALVRQLCQPRVPKSSLVVSILLVLCACITSTTSGYDGSMMNGLNMLESYTEYFHLTTATRALATASLWIGGAIAGLTYGKVTDMIGRRYALFWAAVMTALSVILQTCAKSIAMFVVGRILVGYGTSASTLTGPTYLAETLPYHWRGWGLGVLNDCYYVGGLIAAGVTYKTATMETTLAWRIPSGMQGIFSVLCICVLPFLPESPRWLCFVGRREEALVVIAQTYADGDIKHPIVLAQFKQIEDTMDYERDVSEILSVKQIFSTAISRKRIILAVSAAVFSTVSGNVIASYYLGTMLGNAGITDSKSQLQVNIFLNLWCLGCALTGTIYIDKIGRKLTGLISTASLTIFLFLVGALTKGSHLLSNSVPFTAALQIYSSSLKSQLTAAVYGTSDNSLGIYCTVAAIFLFQGAYSFGWTPLLYLYPPEVLNYPIRANGMGVFTFVLNAAALISVFSFPFVLNSLGWKTYMINGGWDVIEVVFISYLWIETSGKTLEEIDSILEGRKHSEGSNLEDERRIQAASEVRSEDVVGLLEELED